MSNFISFITQNLPQLLAVLGIAAGLFAAIAKLTPTPKDDGVAAAILNFLNLLPKTGTQVTDTKEDEDKPTPVL